MLNSFLIVFPLFVIIFLLYKNVNMIISGFIGGVLSLLVSMYINGSDFDLVAVNAQLLKSIPDMLNFAGPIINSALAMAVFKSGGYVSALTLVKKVVNNRIEYLAVFVVLLQAAATYMSGIGGGSAMVIAPLAFAAVGVIPEVIAAMSIASAFAFTTSPASLETSIVAQQAGIQAIEYAHSVQFITLIALLVSCCLAYYGAYKVRRKNHAHSSSNLQEQVEQRSNRELFANTIPVIYLLFSVILGPLFNKVLPIPLFLPLTNILVVIILITIFTNFKLNQAADAVVDGSNYILTRLLGVGIFITFIRVIADAGAFTVIVSAAQGLPNEIILPALILAGFAIGVPSGAYVGAILALVLPIAVNFNLAPIELGFIAMGVGLGSQMCFVNITMQALSTGFQIPILQVVKGNTPWVLIALTILIVSSFLI